MFERRLKIVLIILLVFAGVLVVRAATIQIVYHQHWSDEAALSLRGWHPIETTRGNILDCKNRELAMP